MDKLRPRKWFRLLIYVVVVTATLGVLMSMAAAFTPEVPTDIAASSVGTFVGRFIDLPHLIGAHRSGPYDEKNRTITLAVDESVDLERIRITYRGLADEGRFKIETIIPNFDREMFFRHEVDTDAAEQGFRLYRDQFELITAKADRLKLRHVSNHRQ